MVTAFYAGRGEADRPKTREQYEEEKRVAKGGKPEEPSPVEWKQQEEAARFHDLIRDNYYKLAQSPYHFEDVMYFPDHLFPEPKEPTVKTAKEMKREMRRMDDQATQEMISALEELSGKG